MFLSSALLHRVIQEKNGIKWKQENSVKTLKNDSILKARDIVESLAPEIIENEI